MKKIHRKIYGKGMQFFLCAILIFCLVPITAQADMGPKPEINIYFEGCENEIYASLFSDDGDPSNGAFDGTSGGTRVPDEIQKAFADYRDYSLSDESQCPVEIWIIDDSNNLLHWGYNPPDRYKLVIYLPETEEFIESNVYESFQFKSNYSINLQERDEQGKLVMHEINESVLDYMLSPEIIINMILTLLVEMGIAYLFSIRGRNSMIVVALTNITTQIMLDVALVKFIIMAGGGWAMIILYFLAEIFIAIFEAVLYAIILRKTNKTKVSVLRAILYSFTANAASFWGGILINWIGLIVGISY